MLLRARFEGLVVQRPIKEKRLSQNRIAKVKILQIET